MLYINHKTDDTPDIVFDLKTFTLSVIGNSYPENCELVYLPVIDFLDAYDFKNNKRLNLEFHFDLINSTSVVYIAQLFSKISAISNQDILIKVKWSFDEFDEELKELGERFSSISKIPFQYNSIASD
tara:strand:+ start:196 stop:576 length:381 start_codon:yes stop_codon:yes gene_type:complete